MDQANGDVPADDAPFDGRVPPPDFAGIETTRFCNLRCRMCLQFNDGTTVAGPHMELHEFERIANSLFPYVSRWQPTVSGEPTMSQGFEQMLAIAERFGVKAEMFSNGTLLKQSMIEKLAPNLGSMSISFDGVSKETFEHIREGADYDQVIGNVQRLMQHCRETLPADLQPLFALNCTLMERNIRELPDLVRFAKRLGMGHLSCYHVFPVTDEMKRQSLVHHRELAIECLDEAFRVAEELDMPLQVQALDQLTAATANDFETKRSYAIKDGVVEGLELRSYAFDRGHRWPGANPDHPEHEQIRQRRAAARRSSGFPSQPPPRERPAAGVPEPVWHCHFLWSKTYVAIGGDVRPCCVDGVPILGNAVEQPFEEIWNNENYRAMRQRLVAKDPAPACRGCMHVVEVRDAKEIDRLLLGRRAPRTGELPPMPAALDPASRRRQRSGKPPELTWPAVDGAQNYVLQFSLDEFGSILWATDGPMGGAIRTNRYQVPVWAWRDAPVDRAISYRVLARLPDGEREVARGSVAAESVAG
ncbi:MAG: SPASM domain-containing protein [Planctomycetes bacterium]|nr:SPASM domain-containing protein [Planctomycetota bacterium]